MKEMKKLFILEEDQLAAAELKQRLASSQWIKVCGEASGMEGVWSTIQAAQPDIVLIGSVKSAEIGVLCQQIRLCFPHIAFIAACSARELHWEPFFRNLGIWVLTKPVDVAQLEMVAGQAGMTPFGPPFHQPPFSPAFAVAEARQEKPYPVRSPEEKRLITIYGPKGGVGKTFLSRELAVYFAGQKKEGRPLNVLAVDFNLDLGTIATSLNLPRSPNLYTWVQAIDEQLNELAVREGRDPATVTHEEWQEYSMAVRLSPQDVSKYVVVHQETSLHVLTSPRDIRQSFEIKDYHLYIMLETLKQSHYDIVLIDTAPDTTDATIQALFFAQRVVMVGNPVVDAIENIQRMLKLLREAEYPEERIHICLNRLQRREMFTVEEIRGYFQLHPSRTLYTIPDDPEVKRSINTGVPLMLYPGRSAAKEAIETLGKVLGPSFVGESAAAVQTASKKRSSWLRWLRK
ncbi:AAA family ATPase [Brevibacillus sp. SYP-B805]|uniref:AAA family ATPase n=1 Tax=Brevibacillus sp. SYP-B805 TaxID=1578199 RepID=UPI0013EBB089|nr:AAA family ATPase [Brevibacillus sp. SYP-B805]NGQ96442.1 AAA family ATPase [Brevibacillus sp. SYP-B805]